MLLKNKKTGEIGNLLPYGGEDGKIWVWIDNISRPEYRYGSLAELNEEWEDYEEPDLTPDHIFLKGSRVCIDYKSVEAGVKAVEKLKAWKRLRDKGFRFRGYEIIDGTIKFMILPKGDYREKVYDDLGLLFGGEE